MPDAAKEKRACLKGATYVIKEVVQPEDHSMYIHLTCPCCGYDGFIGQESEAVTDTVDNLVGYMVSIRNYPDYT